MTLNPMPTMKAIQVSAPGADFELVNREIPEPKKGEVLIKVQACGVCHGEAVIKEGHFPGLTYPRIPGHEVMGVINKPGPDVTDWRIGQRVGVGWHGGHCFRCPACRRGDFWACENSPITGITVDGGYAEYMIARVEALEAIPEELDAVRWGPLALRRSHGVRCLEVQQRPGRRFGGYSGYRRIGTPGRAVCPQTWFQNRRFIAGDGQKGSVAEIGSPCLFRYQWR